MLAQFLRQINLWADSTYKIQKKKHRKPTNKCRQRCIQTHALDKNKTWIL